MSAQPTISTAKITRQASDTVDTIPLAKFLVALRNCNHVDNIIIINDIQYNLASAVFVLDVPPS